MTLGQAHGLSGPMITHKMQTVGSHTKLSHPGWGKYHSSLLASVFKAHRAQFGPQLRGVGSLERFLDCTARPVTGQVLLSLGEILQGRASSFPFPPHPCHAGEHSFPSGEKACGRTGWAVPGPVTTRRKEAANFGIRGEGSGTKSSTDSPVKEQGRQGPGHAGMSPRATKPTC